MRNVMVRRVGDQAELVVQGNPLMRQPTLTDQLWARALHEATRLKVQHVLVHNSRLRVRKLCLSAATAEAFHTFMEV